uniref:Uncharacterized protein n=1 Tax=Desertifilum tharense IPPAS B-1220 TaxID=1781255 RepID=A0ACD5GW09_9CYAN
MKRVSWLPYIFLGLVTNAAVGGAAYYYLETTPPTYTSTWYVTLPSLGSSTNINLPGIGGLIPKCDRPTTVKQATPEKTIDLLPPAIPSGTPPPNLLTFYQANSADPGSKSWEIPPS